MRAGAGRAGDEAVLLGDVGGASAARTLANRLVVEGLGARAEGTEVWVRAADHERALTCARLFHEVDSGHSRVAPPPGAWASTGAGRTARTAVVAVLALVVAAALFVAIGL